MAYAVDLAKPGGAWPKSSPSQSEIERVGRNPEFAADSALEREHGLELSVRREKRTGARAFFHWLSNAEPTSSGVSQFEFWRGHSLKKATGPMANATACNVSMPAIRANRIQSAVSKKENEGYR